MVVQETFFAELRARRPDVFGEQRKRHSRVLAVGSEEVPIVDSKRVVWRSILEQELRGHQDAQKKALLRAELLRCYAQDGYEKDEPKKLLEAVEEKEGRARRRIIESKVRRFGGTQQYGYAADELQALGEWRRSGEMWLKAGESSGSATEYLFAADSFARGGEAYERACLRVAGLLKARIASLGARGRTTLSGIYYDHVNALGELLTKAGKHDEALATYLSISNDEEYDRHGLAAGFWEEVGDLQKAIAAKEKFIKAIGTPSQDDFLKLAELRARAGDWKGHAKARWMAGDFLHAARVMRELTGKSGYFKQAAEAYLKKPFNTSRDFFGSVWHLVEKASRSADAAKGVAKALSLLHAAHGLPAPPAIEELDAQSHWKRASELSKQFVELRRRVRGRKVVELFREGLHARALLHAAASHNSGKIGFAGELKRLFKGLPRPRRPTRELPKELADTYQSATRHQQYLYGGDPQEMAGRCYEEGSFYKEAAAAYKKAELPDDAARVKALTMKEPRQARGRK